MLENVFMSKGNRNLNVTLGMNVQRRKLILPKPELHFSSVYYVLDAFYSRRSPIYYIVDNIYTPSKLKQISICIWFCCILIKFI